MAYYQKATFSTANDLLADLVNFLTANGWTVDFSGTYNTSYYRVHFHNDDGAHFDFYSTSVTAFQGYGCTGYVSGSDPSAQTNASSGNKTWTGVVGYDYWFVSTEGGIFIAVTNASGSYYWGGVFVVSDKIDSWTEGFGIQGGNSLGKLFLGGAYGSSLGAAQIYYNEAWSTYNSAAGALYGNASQSSSDIAVRQPAMYNSGIIPFPTVLFIINSSDTSKYHPIGYAPGVYRTNGGDIYDVGDEITIGSDTYLILPSYYNEIGQGVYCDWLFKLGA